MSIATYRGVKYDTVAYANKETENKKVLESYRGIEYTKTVRVEK